jgi:hypothetical protein
MKPKPLLFTCAVLLAAVALFLLYVDGDEQTAPQASDATRTGESAADRPPRPGSDPVEIHAVAPALASESAETSRARLESWAARDLSGFAEWFCQQRTNDEQHQLARDILADELARRDPSSRFTWMEKSLPESVRRELYGPFFRAWTEVNPATAGAKLRALADGAGGGWDNLIGQIASVWSKKDPPAAMDWLQSLPAGEAKALALVQATYRWVDADASAAAAYAARHRDPTLLKAAADRWAENDAASAAAWAAALPAEAGRDDVIGRITAKWSSTDPAATARWATQLPESPTREQAFGQLVTVWAAADRPAAERWLQTLPATRSRDFAVSAFCNATESTDPDASLQWARTIAAPALRAQRLERIAASADK